MHRLVFFALFVLLTQICVGDELAAYCDVCRLVNPDTKCPEGVECTDGQIEVEEGIVGVCTKKHFTVLKVSGMGLTEIPGSVNNMTHLTTLNIADNEIETLPVLDKLESLDIIFMHVNKIKNFTGVFVNSVNVTYLSASNNELIELPPELANMKLNTLLVANNNIKTIPQEYRKMKNLKNLDLSDNDLDCKEIRSNFSGTIFAQECIAPQQKSDKEGEALPLDYSGEPTKEGLDSYEIVSIVLACVFVVLLVIFIALFVWYRGKSITA